jgi:DNA-binding NarL/FixJ family response regulator
MANVLLLEDEFWIAIGVQECLVDFGHVVIGPFQNNAHACAAVLNCSVDVAILDVYLGNGSNSGSTAKLLASLGVPFLVLSGSSPGDTSGFEAAVAWLVKPLGEGDIIDAIEKALGLSVA